MQTLASSRLMPVREQMLQLRRRIHNRADEVKAAKAAVERETMADTGAIVGRLRSVEALKQVLSIIDKLHTPQNDLHEQQHLTKKYKRENVV